MRSGRRRRFYGSAGGELIHGPVHHAAFEGTAGYSLKYFEGAPARFWRTGRPLQLDGLAFVVVNAGEPYAFEVTDPARTRITAAFFAEAEVRSAWAGALTPEARLLDAPDTAASPAFSDFLHRPGPGLARALAALRARRDAGALEGSQVDEVLADLLSVAVGAEAGIAHLRIAGLRSRQREELLRRLSLARRFIEARADGELSLDEMAAAANLSKYHFLRRFRDVFGMAPGAYHRRVRLERAAERLARGAPSLTNLALDAGYRDLAAFSRAFRRRFGVPPSQWRAKPQLRTS
ncbi:helix-turn-helix transcriptional regulator [Phenylobacterium terrae]|uniref:Helix-turn-helix transcriptional regulator n=1 Tax=Phenylobacterium terrae TaxID=2665495 RepID=A0ABW4MXH5_9CAUL